MSATELSVLFTSKGNLQNELSGLRKELQGVQKEIKAATDAGDTGKVDALSRDYANLSGRIDATRASLRKVNSEIKDTANDGVKSTAKLQGAWKKLQGVMKTPLFTAATVAGVALFGKKAVEAFAQAEQSQLRLVEAYRKFDAVQDVPIQAIRDLASELQSLTGTDDDALAAAAGTLARFNLTGAAVQRLLPLVNDFAIATGRDVVDASTSVGRAMLGNARALKELGINFKSTGDTGKDFEVILAALEDKVGGTGKAFGETAQGGLTRAQAAFGDLQEEIGGTLVPALTALLRVVEPAAKFFSGLPGPIKGVAIAIGVLSAAALAVGPRIAVMITGMKAAGIEAAAMRGKMAAAGSFLAGPWGVAIAAATLVMGAFATAQADAQAKAQALVDTLDAQTGAITALTRQTLGQEFLKNFSIEDLEQTPFTLDEIVTASLEGGAALEDLRLRVENYSRELLKSNPTQIRWLSSLQSSLEAAERDGKAMRELAQLNDYAARETAGLTEEVTGVTRQLVVLGRELPLVSYKASDYYRALSSAKSATDGLTDSLSKLSAAVSEWGARDNFKRALKDFIEKPSADAARAMITNMDQAAASIEDPGERAQFTVDAIGKIREALKSEGMKVPQSVRDSLNSTEADALKVLEAVKLVDSAIDNMPDSKTVKIFLETYGRVPASVTDAGAGPSTGSDASGDWNGGYVRGPGTATSDSIRMRLSNGEFVMRAAAVKAIGVQNLYRMNSEKAIDPALLERAEVQGHNGPLIGQVIVHNPAENVDVERAVATAIRKAERKKRERG